MDSSISWATPAIVAKQRRIILRDTLGVLTLHENRLGFVGANRKLVFEADLPTLVVTPQRRTKRDTAFAVTLPDGAQWLCAFWYRNPKISPVYLRTNYVDVAIQDVDLTDKQQARGTCAGWLRLLDERIRPTA